ncbi:hypothetical protein PF001_g5648 [Phytophthora fragariae]|uniref:WD repeat and coiled-coil-containing protein n=1 Tax=Phytophthora fragariae TaxID=53985 RepID=A0A6A4E545_9STRA|nr:hypothetical protein PF004_g7196 [Phytophthora fragariae]KAE9319934.1 hypothetical protein PF001_g5648 [Phytophthora fragariae]
MLIDGPVEWSEALLATGVKSNLLRNGYNSKMQVSAMSLGPTVAITRYTDADSTAGFARGILDQPSDSLVLHEENAGSDTMASRYRLVAWSSGSTEKSLLAIASATRVEIWEITVTSGISAILKGSVDINHSQGLAWNSCNEVLLVYSKTELQLVNASHPTLSWRTIHSDSRIRHAWRACSWSPCGLHASLAQNHVLHSFSWEDKDSLGSGIPKHDQIESSSIKVFENIPRADPASSVMNSDLGDTLSVGSSLLLRSESSRSSGIIDLTSIRISTSSNQSSLQILNRVEAADTRITPFDEKPRSNLLIVENKAGQWSVTSIVELPHLTSTDLLVVQDMRVIVGSCLSPRLVVAHLDVSDRMEWTASLSGELELPPTHVCRGIYLAERSPFVDVASTERRKRATFFHASASLEPQPVFVSTFKVPRRARGCTQESTAIATDKTAKSPADGGENKDLLELIFSKMTARFDDVDKKLQQLNTRFDDVDKKLQQLTARVEQK